ncbi:MAG: RNA methyltransferase, partial [Rhodocyclaceae bacterium]
MNSNPSAFVAPDAFGRVRVVLVRPSHPGNIGAAARAMKTMGFSRLVLVAPKVFPDPHAEAMASGAADVLASARVVGSMPAALEGVTFALALTSRRRELATSPLWARPAASELAQAAVHSNVALVFGNETTGLTNEELAHCNRWAMIPANPAYASLNLAAAVQVMCYELRLAIEEAWGAVPPAPIFASPGTPATHEEVEGLVAQLENAAM